MKNYRVDNLNELIEAAKDPTMGMVFANSNTVDQFSMYCPFCFKDIRTKVKVLVGYYNLTVEDDKYLLTDTPLIYKCTCANCKNNSYILLYAREDRHDMSIIYTKSASFGTPNAHPAVNYYLDQAQRAHSMGANSAAVAMFRSALEQLMHQQGYEKGMLHQKLQDLDKDIASGNAPKWAIQLDTEFLDVIKKLGNTSIHPNGGDITAQDKLDANLVTALQTTFLEILDIVYEAPARKAARKALLQSAVAKP